MRSSQLVAAALLADDAAGPAWQSKHKAGLRGSSRILAALDADHPSSTLQVPVPHAAPLSRRLAAPHHMLTRLLVGQQRQAGARRCMGRKHGLVVVAGVVMCSCENNDPNRSCAACLWSFQY